MADVQSISPVLTVSDVDASMAFYRNVLGFPDGNVLRTPGGHAVHAMVQNGSAMIHFGPAEGASGSPERRGSGVIFYVELGDDYVDRYYESVVRNGANVVEPIETKPWGDRTFIVADPDGYQLMFAKPVRSVSMEEMQAALSPA